MNSGQVDAVVSLLRKCEFYSRDFFFCRDKQVGEQLGLLGCQIDLVNESGTGQFRLYHVFTDDVFNSVGKRIVPIYKQSGLYTEGLDHYMSDDYKVDSYSDAAWELAPTFMEAYQQYIARHSVIIGVSFRRLDGWSSGTIIRNKRFEKCLFEEMDLKGVSFEIGRANLLTSDKRGGIIRL